jgi:hypothetical protein
LGSKSREREVMRLVCIHITCAYICGRAVSVAVSTPTALALALFGKHLFRTQDRHHTTQPNIDLAASLGSSKFRITDYYDRRSARWRCSLFCVFVFVFAFAYAFTCATVHLNMPPSHHHHPRPRPPAAHHHPRSPQLPMLAARRHLASAMCFMLHAAC